MRDATASRSPRESAGADSPGCERRRPPGNKRAFVPWKRCPLALPGCAAPWPRPTATHREIFLRPAEFVPVPQRQGPVVLGAEFAFAHAETRLGEEAPGLDQRLPIVAVRQVQGIAFGTDGTRVWPLDACSAVAARRNLQIFAAAAAYMNFLMSTSRSAVAVWKKSSAPKSCRMPSGALAMYASSFNR